MTKGAIVFLCSSMFALGGFGGAVLGNKLTAKRLKEKFAKEKKEELEFTRNYYKKKYCSKPAKEEQEPLVTNVNSSDSKSEVKNPVTPTTFSSSEIKNDEIEKIVQSYTPEPEQDYPYLITCDEYGMFGDPDYTTVNLYWRGDSTLLDEAGDLVDIGSTIGYEALDQLRKHKDDDPYVYVRNPVLKIDYEVVWDSYLEPRNKGSDHSKKDW